MRDYILQPIRQGQRYPSPLLTELRPEVFSQPSEQESPPLEVGPFDSAVLSWNGSGNWRLELRLRIGGQWTPYALMGVMTGLKCRSATRSESERFPGGLPCSLEIDTLRVKEGAKADAFQVRVIGDGVLSALCVTHYRANDRRYTARPAVDGAWGVTLPVPERSQGAAEDPAIRSEVCSPTSVSMVLAYHGRSLRTVDMARQCLDHQTRIYGNWPVNTLAASRVLGGWAAVVKMRGFDQIEQEIARRRPVILSHRWERGDLTNAPISRSSGHLIVAVGFTESGDVVVNDPAGRVGSVRRVYRRPELFRTWQERGDGIVYLIHPAI